MSEQETEVVEELETEAAPPEDQLNEFFDKLEAKPTAEVVDADPEETEEPETEEPEPTVVEGPTLAMKLFAKQQGLSEKLIASAKSDEQLNVIVEEFTAQQTREAEPEPIKEPEFNLVLPEDEFPADDPVRKQFVELKNHYDGKVKQLEGYIGQLADIALKTESSLKVAEENQVLTEQQEFDAYMDGLGIAALGSRAEARISSIGQKLRQSLYWEMKDLETEHPKATRQELLERVAQEAGYLSPKQKREQAVRSDNARRLGGGPAKPAPAREMTKDEKLDALFDRLDAAKK